jgi:alanine or glycine:cation symporter, AGCS family
LFWLLVSGLFGMATKFSEITIALHYRERDASGVMRGGAMYVLSKGLKMPWLGAAFAMLTSLAAFGIGNMVQANSVADAVFTSYGVPQALTAGCSACWWGWWCWGASSGLRRSRQCWFRSCAFFIWAGLR